MTTAAKTAEATMFTVGQAVTREDVKPIVSPCSDIDYVEGFRLDRIAELSTEVLSGQLPPHEAKQQIAEIGHWAGFHMTEHFPVELSQTR